MEQFDVTNPVGDFYAAYSFNTKLPIVYCSTYEDVINKAKSVKTSCILYNKQLNTITDKQLDINLTYNKDLEVVLILNVELKGKSALKVSGKNFTLSNISFIDGSKSYKAPDHIVEINAENFKMINFSMINFKCADSDKDYFRVKESAKNFQLYNSLLDGKTNNGVFLRLDFPLNNYINCCVFKNIDKGSTANGGETIRLATSGFENKDAFCTIDRCYFNNCKSDPEIVSVKCSSNTIKNCIFENNGDSKLVLRHAHRCLIDRCYFSGSGMRVYGTKHLIQNSQLVNNANILLDDKSGSSYVVAQDVKVNYIYYDNVKTPVTNDGKNCSVTNIIKELKITKNDLLSKSSETPVDPPVDPIIEIIPDKVDSSKLYKLNSNLTTQQIQYLKEQINSLKL